jgi:hypothetical protein
MPRDGNGHYFYPPGTPGAPDTTIESGKYNAYIDDMRQDANSPRPITAGGTGASTPQDARTNLGVMPATGGTLTGDVTIAPTSGNANLLLKKPASGGSNDIIGYTAALPRWLIRLGNEVPETGGNAGSDFSIWRYNDAGDGATVALSINRATRATTITGATTINGATAFNGTSTITGDLYSNRSANEGVLWLGSNGTHYLHWSGTSYVLNAGPLSVGGALTCNGPITGHATNVHGITCHNINTQGNTVTTAVVSASGDIGAGGSIYANGGILRFGNDGVGGTARYLHWNGTNYHLGGSGDVYTTGNLPAIPSLTGFVDNLQWTHIRDYQHPNDGAFREPDGNTFFSGCTLSIYDMTVRYKALQMGKYGVGWITVA